MCMHWKSCWFKQQCVKGFESCDYQITYCFGTTICINLLIFFDIVCLWYQLTSFFDIAGLWYQLTNFFGIAGLWY